MSTKPRAKNLVALVAAFYAVAMLALGFSHVSAAPTAFGPAANGLASLPDGTPVVLCLGAASPKGQGTPDRDPAEHAAHFCAACCLTAAPGALLTPPRLLALDSLAGVRMKIVTSLASAAKSAALAPQSRGPPAA